jgi:hypothetical protein
LQRFAQAVARRFDAASRTVGFANPNVVGNGIHGGWDVGQNVKA